MTTTGDIHNKIEKLIQQLGGLKFIVDTSKDVLNKNPVSNEFLAFKIDIACNLLEELRLWETLGSQNNCNSLLENAQFFLDQAQVFMDLLLDEHCEEAWLDYQRELRFTEFVTTPHEQVLKTTRERLALAA